MRISVLALAVSISTAAGASAMAPATATYLREIGIDPKSKEVIAVDKEGTVKTEYSGDPEEYSLDKLAAKKKKNGIVAFIATRGFIRRLKKDFTGTSIPQKYDPSYLTVKERAIVAPKFSEDSKK